MTKVKRHVLLEGMSGTLGKNLVFRQMRDGSTIVSAKPDFSRRIFSTEQLTHQSRFQEAVAYARLAAKTNPIYAELANGTTKTAYNIALSDWFNPPVIHHIKQESGRIFIEASDNVLVTKITVTILDAEGQPLEQGQAVQVNSLCWEYVTSQAGKVIVNAFDLPGNQTSQEMSVG